MINRDKTPIPASNLIWLSHTWGPSCPAYAGGARVEVTANSSLSAGDSSNSLRFSATNHIGTHMDFPLHFCAEGEQATDYSPDYFFFTNPMLVDLTPLEDERIILTKYLESFLNASNEKIRNTDILLLRTGCEAFRDQDKYWSDGTGIGSGVAEWIRKHMPKCRAVGIDAISISSFSNRPLGRKVHKEFLCHINPICLIEDMKLSGLEADCLNWMIVLPLRIEAADAAPVTIIAHKGFPNDSLMDLNSKGRLK